MRSALPGATGEKTPPQKNASTASDTAAFSAKADPPILHNPSSHQSNSTFEYCGTISRPNGSPDFTRRTSHVLYRWLGRSSA